MIVCHGCARRMRQACGDSTEREWRRRGRPSPALGGRCTMRGQQAGENAADKALRRALLLLLLLAAALAPFLGHRDARRRRQAAAQRRPKGPRIARQAAAGDELAGLRRAEAKGAARERASGVRWRARWARGARGQARSMGPTENSPAVGATAACAPCRRCPAAQAVAASGRRRPAFASSRGPPEQAARRCRCRTSRGSLHSFLGCCFLPHAPCFLHNCTARFCMRVRAQTRGCVPLRSGRAKASRRGSLPAARFFQRRSWARRPPVPHQPTAT